MARNVEIKAHLTEEHFDEIINTIESLDDEVVGPNELIQSDTFFESKIGRLKLREFADDQMAELIFYHRTDQTGPKTSNYQLIPIPEPDMLKMALEQSNGIREVVKKQRTLYLIGQTRIHLDRVERLGSFLELEVVLRSDQSPEQGVEVANSLMDTLQITPDQLIENAYVDLLLAKLTPESQASE